MYQKALSGPMSRYRRRDIEATRLIDKFNFIKNLIQDMVEIEASTRGQPAKTIAKSDTRSFANE
jgi:hypothetical protein